MISIVKKAQCTAKPEPRAWQTARSSGITYRVGISDGSSNLELRCKDDDVYYKFEPFNFYQVALETSQVARNDSIIESTRIVDCQLLEE